MFSSLLSTFLRSSCPLCDRTGRPLLCRDCERQLDDCRITSSVANASGVSRTKASSESSIVAWGAYGGLLKRAIHLMKYEGQPDIGTLLGQRLGEHWLERVGSQKPAQRPSAQRSSAQRPLVLVPVPLHRDRFKQRGYNQAELIAQQFSRVTGLPCLPQGLLRVKATAAQHQLSPRDRRHNLKGAFRLGPDWTVDRMTARVLLVDDIYTTGTTVRAAAAELRRSGIRVVGIAAAARATWERPRLVQAA